MKKVISALIVLSLVLSMFMISGCGDADGNADKETTKATETMSTNSEPTQSESTEPEPTQSEPTEPEPTEPEPTEPEPTEPEPTESEPTEPKPTEPKPTEPKPTAPEPTEPEPTEPEPTDPPEPPASIDITGPTGEVVPYIKKAKQYLASGEDVQYFYANTSTAAQAIVITWESNFTPASFTVRYGTDSNLSDCIELQVEGTVNTCSAYNLLKGATYYVEVSAQNENGGIVIAKSTFTTTSVGPRVMNIDGIYNTRDVGGYKTADGKMTLQNMIFRGGALLPCSGYRSISITEEGKKYMSEELGIKLEIDFRSPSEAEYSDSASVIPGARLEFATLSGYADAFTGTAGYKKAFQLMADKNNYPIYMHCTGGADRTGTVAFLLNALLGVAEEELIHDYEFTTFSIYSIRSTKGGIYAPRFAAFRETLDTFEGDTLAEKVESYLLSIGVTQQEIDSIRAIMTGGNA